MPPIRLIVYGTLAGGGLLAAASVATMWDSRLFAGDNVAQFVFRSMRLYPSLFAAKTNSETQVARDKMALPYPFALLAEKFGFEVRKVQVPVEGDTIPVQIFKPKVPGDAPLPVIVWFHGGGMCIGDSDDVMLTSLPIVGLRVFEHFQGKAVVVSVEYRLAPEHRFPTGVEDCIAATRWLHDNASSFNGDSARMSVAGVSSGGYLAATVHQAARDRGFPLCAALMVVPMLRRGATTESFVQNGRTHVLPTEAMVWFWNTYAPDATVVTDPRCEPVRGIGAGNLAPCMVVTCEYDVLRDEGVEYYKALRDAGVAAEHVRCRTTHICSGADKERWNQALRWLADAIGIATPSRL